MRCMLVIKTEQSKYSEVLKVMRSGAKLVDLEADVRSIRCSRTGEMILEFKRDMERMGAVYKCLKESLVGVR